jgi:hypothetical protein
LIPSKQPLPEKRSFGLQIQQQGEYVVVSVIRHEGGSALLALDEAFLNGGGMEPPGVEHETVIRQLDEELEQIQQVNHPLFRDATCWLPQRQGLHQDAVKVFVDIQGTLFRHSKSYFRKHFRMVSGPPCGKIRVVREESHAVSESGTFVYIPKKGVLRLLEERHPPSKGFVCVIKVVGTLQIRMMIVLVDTLKIRA